MKKHVIIPIFVPHKGCPNDCIFCNQKKISGQTDEMTPEKVPHIIEEHLATIKDDAFAEIAFYGGSFTAISKDLQEAFLRQAARYISSGVVSEIRISTRPDCIDAEILSMLERYGVKTIELGVQSLDDDVLTASCRGHDSGIVYKAAGLIKKMGFRLGIQTMTGLPLDTREKCLQTANKVVSIAPEIVRIYPVLVIKGTGLERLMNEGRYVPQKLEEAVDLCAELLQIYEKNGIKVIRIGLQATDNIRQGSDTDVIAGPVHPAFRQLVEARVALMRIEELIGKQDLAGAKELAISTGIPNISNVVGQRRSNINYLKSKYGFTCVKVIPDSKLGREIICSKLA